MSDTLPRRLPAGGDIDRSRRLRFRFNRVELEGHPGDTLASALLANGVRMVARSFKYHRPRGIVTAGAEEPNAIVQLGGDDDEPNARATTLELRDGMQARSVNCWPGLHFDLGALNDRLARLFAAGFYYKTFIGPARRLEPLRPRAAAHGRPRHRTGAARGKDLREAIPPLRRAGRGRGPDRPLRRARGGPGRRPGPRRRRRPDAGRNAPGERVGNRRDAGKGVGEAGGGGAGRLPPGDPPRTIERRRRLRPQPVQRRRAQSVAFLRRRTPVESSGPPGGARDRRVGTASRLRRQRPSRSDDGERGAGLRWTLRGAPRGAGGGGHQQQLDLLRRAGTGRCGARGRSPRRPPPAASARARAGDRVPGRGGPDRLRRGARARRPGGAGGGNRALRPAAGAASHRLRPRAVFRRLGSARPSPLPVGGATPLPAPAGLLRAGREHPAATKRRGGRRRLRAARLPPGRLGSGSGGMPGPGFRRPRGGSAPVFGRGAARDRGALGKPGPRRAWQGLRGPAERRDLGRPPPERSRGFSFGGARQALHHRGHGHRPGKARQRQRDRRPVPGAVLRTRRGGDHDLPPPLRPDLLRHHRGAGSAGSSCCPPGAPRSPTGSRTRAR